MNHADRITMIIRNIEIALEVYDENEIHQGLEDLSQIRDEMLAADEVAG